MDEVRSIFWEALVGCQPWTLPEQRRAALDMLEKAIASWSHAGANLYAGICASVAEGMALGDDREPTFLKWAISELESAMRSALPATPEAVVARSELITVLGKVWSPGEDLRSATSALKQDLAMRLDSWFVDTPRAATFAIKGMNYVTDMAGAWEESEPVGEAESSIKWWGGGKYGLAVPSAFNLLLSAADYRSAYEMSERYVPTLVTPHLRAWHAASKALSVDTPTRELLEVAAEAFERDVMPTPEELSATKRSWSGESLMVWGPYFRARAELAAAVEDPATFRDHLHRAASYFPPGISFFVVPAVVRFSAFLHALVRLLEEGAGLTPLEVNRNLRIIEQVSGSEPIDEALRRFLGQAEAALEGFRRNPVAELGTLRWNNILAGLDEIMGTSLMGRETGVVAKNALNEQAVQIISGYRKTWVYEGLEAIRDERQLQRVLLALLRGQAPRYVQVRHGPLECGKDIVVIEENDGRCVLRMFQVKCGDISVPIWRGCKHELEVMFDVPLETANYHGTVDECSGILLFTGHVKPNADGEVRGWISSQLRDHNRRYELFTIDDIVRWIQGGLLYRVFKAALSAEGIIVGA